MFVHFKCDALSLKLKIVEMLSLRILGCGMFGNQGFLCICSLKFSHPSPIGGFRNCLPFTTINVV